ncbi:hypothetical protein DC20_13455 [Rufibacter tibetensis]|uniref:Sulfatase N-terminal domain-containing protein n=1 Tax=Rufibacter tibetensis TaxID=512763 RepID=A0A0P0CNZ4_9BACT|nr:hypothetical protein DC20_13455 [Rufibacter tibetensis]
MCLFGACQSSSPSSRAGSTPLQKPSQTYATQHVILVVIDGVRYSDSWGDSTFSNIPNMARYLAPQGVFNPQFYNQGVTLTNPGHVALTTGYHQKIKNNGDELPRFPSVFHYYRQHTGAPATDAWVVTSKDKLEVLARTYSSDSAAAFAPSVNSGIKGLGTGYRDDTTTIRVAKQVLSRHQPKLMLINLREPDSEAHAGNWNGYLKAIRQSDRLVADLWKWLQKQPQYQNNTTLLITNDHGRHTGKNFESHGDNCEGCRHISLLALGPDLKRGKTVTQPRSQADVAATIAELLGFPIPKRDGEPMTELFQEHVHLGE